MAKKYKCPYCNDRLIRKDLINHIDKEHEELIPDGSESAQIVFDLVNGTKGAGRCRVCNGPTVWNPSSKRYDILCKNPRCKEKMREDYQKNMLRVHGTYNILTSDEQQKKMLANRSISGKYKFTDGGIVTYTGSYEKKFLEFADKVMQIPSKDIMAPGPTIEYEMNGEKHFYITDFLYIPYNLIIEVKDGGTNPNNKNTPGMQSSRQRTIEKERLITDRGEYNYLRLTDNQFVQLLEIFMDIKKALIEGNDDKIVRINESYINESKSTIDNNYKPKGKKNLSSFKRIHLTETVIDKYKKEYPFLKNVRCKDTEEYICDGYIWFDNNELVCMVGSCEYTDDKTKWIVSLEITKNYKGYGLSKQIVDYAVKSMNCKYLSVNKNNEIAKKVYDNYGFKVYQEDNTMYYMTIDKNVKESYLEEGLGSQIVMSVPIRVYNTKNKTPINNVGDLIKYHKNPGLVEYANKCDNIKDLKYIKKDTYRVISSINTIKERISLCIELGDCSKTSSYYKFIKKNCIDAGITVKDCDATINWVKSFCKSLDDKINKLEKMNESSVKESYISESRDIVYDQNLTNFTAYHLEPVIAAKNKKHPSRIWDEELYSKSIEGAINNDIKYNYECKRYDRVSAYVYAAGKNLKPIYLGTITIFDKNNPNDWEWEEQEILDKKTYDYLLNHPIAEATDISNFYEDEDYE